MASIPTADLDTALDGAVSVGTNHWDTFGDPVVVSSNGCDGGGAFVALLSDVSDLIDIHGQLASRGWRVITSVRNETAGYVGFIWSRV